MRPTVLGVLALASLGYGDSMATRDELNERRLWTAAAFDGLCLDVPSKALDARAIPFDFLFDGKPFRDRVGAWKIERVQRRLDANRIEHVCTYQDPRGLYVRCVAVEYVDFPTVEWTVFLRNDGAAPSPVIEDLRGIDTSFATSQDVVLRHWNGSLSVREDFEPHTDPLSAESTVRIAPEGGRGSSGALPYFGISWKGEGRLLAIGWPGQWEAIFTRRPDGGVRIEGGQDGTRFRLRPGEEVRTPLVVLQFTKDDESVAHNVWRRWMLAHNLPRPDGKVPQPLHVACSSHQFNEMLNADEAGQNLFVDRYVAEKLDLDYWWMDAGWYPNNGGWWNTGTWEVDRKRFPRGLRAVTDHAHEKGLKSILWFEPERVNKGTWLYDDRPQWLLGPDGDDPGHCKLLDLGNSDARAWLIDHIDGILSSQGIDLYRQDFNIAPLDIWRSADGPDRHGLTENHYVTGYLAYWDELRRRHPNMLIDTCASGGRRLDIETLRRSVPLLRSDYIFEPVGQQGHTYGLSFWVPFQGTGNIDTDPYRFRSTMVSSINTCWDVRRKDLDYSSARRLLTQWREVAACFCGDFYPLSPYTLADDQWIAWQYDSPERGEGVVQAFRRAGSPYESARYKLRGLDPKARYAVKDLDTGRSTDVGGKQLMEEGLQLTARSTPSALVVRYRRL